MKNFSLCIPTKINFGKGSIDNLSDLNNYGKKVLLAYGGGSVKRSGLYDKVVSILKKNGLDVYDLSGVEPNPRIQTVRKGAEICKTENIDMVLALGGGSTIDCSKAVAAAAKYNGDAWDLIENPSLIREVLPIFVVLTIAATGSEMDSGAVISNPDINEKRGFFVPAMRPKMSILDPEYTFSVPKRQTSAGVADILSHTLENYLNQNKGAYLQSCLAEAVMRTVIKYGPIALDNPENYEARANLMWASSLAINGLLSAGAPVGWAVHQIEHELSAYYDIIHGEGLAIVTPHYMRFALNEDTIWKFAELGKNVFGIIDGTGFEIAEKAINAIEDFFKTMHLPSTLREVGIEDDSNFEKMATRAASRSKGSFVPITTENIINIYRKSF